MSKGWGADRVWPHVCEQGPSQGVMEPGAEAEQRVRPGPWTGGWGPAPPETSRFKPSLSGCCEGIFVKVGN